MIFKCPDTFVPLPIITESDRQVTGHFPDRVTQLQRLQPSLGNRVDTMQGSEDISRDRAGAVAVARVIYRKDDRLLEIILVNKRAEYCDCERFLTDPTATEGFNHFRCRYSVFLGHHRVCQVDGLSTCDQGLFVVFVFGKFLEYCVIDCVSK